MGSCKTVRFSSCAYRLFTVAELWKEPPGNLQLWDIGDKQRKKETKVHHDIRLHVVAVAGRLGQTLQKIIGPAGRMRTRYTAGARRMSPTRNFPGHRASATVPVKQSQRR
ncbi:hypothetical protein ZHAS_00010907 [Anopheles sinensis]|uniref:Uncharacterized protein n=1 Tax=Anopheles sinensis TaxID=74873 RepID=A0A084VYT6_ANOSI|nr:hypothetical protein ZHAS_00010907 [Anopheles sinensis]